jgi:uncharacterized protein (DUF1501 family)
VRALGNMGEAARNVLGGGRCGQAPNVVSAKGRGVFKMSKLTRREFLVRGGAAFAGSLLTPPILSAPGKLGLGRKSIGKRVLVVCHLVGGNDGLNTVIPSRDRLYYSLRPGLAIPQRAQLPLTRDLALHPSLVGIKKLWDQNQLAIVNGVGYPNPDRSHFRSSMVWHTADPDVQTQIGWLGRYLDSTEADRSAAIAFGEREQIALTGERVSGHTFASFDHAASELKLNANKSSHGAKYADDDFGKRFGEAAKLIASAPDTRVIHIGVEGFDTHVDQLKEHAAALNQFGDALATFLDDVERMGRSDDVAIVAFSEFGRRVEENQTGGTDHGAAGPVFIAGAAIQPGVFGRYPSLKDLDRGDLKHTTDFRSVYASVLRRWLGSDATALGDFRGLPIF